MGADYGNVNEQKFNQLSSVLNAINKQATGEQDATITNSSEFVSVAQHALLTGWDALTNSISQVLSKTIFSYRPYNAKFNSIMVDNVKYGNHVRKLQVVDKDFENDERMSFSDGDTAGVFKINQPEVVQTNYYGMNQYSKSLTIYRDQLDTAFSSVEGFNDFITMVMSNATDMITQAKENEARMTVNNLIAGIYDIGNSYQMINVLDEYNKFSGLTLTTETVYNPENYPNFVRWLYGYIQTISDFLEERSNIYHSPITTETGDEKIINRHTPKANQKMLLLSKVTRLMETVVSSTTYHDNKLVFPNYESIAYWQSIKEPSVIEATPSIVTAGKATAGDDVMLDNVIGILFDDEAMGITTVNEWSATTPFDASKGIYNQYWHFTTRFWNDYSENAVIFYMA